MATYYVRTDGNDSNTGLGSTTALAWQTITKAIGATGIAPGDTLYIAPGVYRGVFTAGFTNPSSEGQRITIAGNPTASQFSGVTAGPVIFTNYNADNVNVTSGDVLTISKNFITLQDVVLYGYTSTNVFTATSSALQVYRCKFAQPATNVQRGYVTNSLNAGSTGFIFSNNVIINCRVAMGGNAHSGQWDSQSVVSDNIFLASSTNTFEGAFSINSATSGQLGGVKVVNNYIQGLYGIRIFSALSTTYPSVIQNCHIESPTTGILSDVSNTSAVVQTYNVINAPTSVTNISTSGTTKTNVYNPLNGSIGRIQGFLDSPFFSPLTTSQAGSNAGVSGNNPAADIYGTTWLAPSTPTIGAAEYQTQPVPFAYLPIERNASAITIAPSSTSQSIELYLGVTGLTFATSGLAAYYVRNQSAPVAITLVTQTPTGAWSSGGFAEISSSLVPGVYRLDVPNAAFAAGASDVTIVVRGASGTNGAVLTVTLSSGGLTAAQTAAAVWDEARSGHTTVGTFGQYVNAELVTPVTSAALVRMGPFEVRADGLGASDPLDIQKGAQHGVDIQCVDNNGAGIDITSATVTAKIYNSGATLVSTLACTATYAADGRATFTLTTAVTNTPGTYTATITRTTGASDTQVFGPLRIYVRDI
jgi:hypothetical protein